MVDLVIDRDHHRDLRLLKIWEPQLSVFQISLADMEIAADPVPSFARQIKAQIFSRMADGVFHIF